MATPTSTFSIWEQESFLSSCDIVIIGAGLSGLWSAWHLKRQRPALRITILERGLLPTGASTRNAGFACFGSPGELVQDVRRSGSAAWEIVGMRYRGLQLLKEVFPEAIIGYEACGGYECFTQGDVWTEVEAALPALNDALYTITGVHDVFLPADGKLGAFGLAGFDHMVTTTLEGALHSGKLVQALLQQVQAMGVTVLTGTDVTHWEERPGGVAVYTGQSFALHGRQLLVCTNGFARHLLPALDVQPARGQVLVTAPVPGLQLHGTFHYDEGYYYFRHVGNRVLLGGARNKAFAAENTDALTTTDAVQAELEQFLFTHILPGQQVAITHRWAGIMGMGSDKSPVVQALTERIFCAVRMSGIGVAVTPITGEAVAALMLQRL